LRALLTGVQFGLSRYGQYIASWLCTAIGWN